MLIAATIGAVYVNVIQPGQPLRSQWSSEVSDLAISDQSPTDLILRVIPTNPMAAIVELDIIGILFFTILLAFAILSLGKKRSAPVFNFFESLNDLIFVLVGWVMALAPFGVGMLIAHTIGTQDLPFLSHLLLGLLKFATTVTLALATHFVVLLLIVWIFGKYNPFSFLRAMSPAMAVAFGTNSSTATMPVPMSCVSNLGVSKRVRNFVIPVGATLNMDGTALFEAVTVIFFAQAFGFDLSFGQQFLVGILAVVAAMGAAGIPSAGLVTMVMVLSAVGLPATKIATIFAIDRPLDMMRTIVNITGDAMTARVVQTRFPDIRPEDDDLASEYEEIDPAASHGS
jgi:Na+/H+-dicarboxylate symporter